MSTTAQPIPDGYHTATPHLVIKDAARAIDFYETAFGGSEMLRLESLHRLRQGGGKGTQLIFEEM